MSTILIKYGTDHSVERLKLNSAKPEDSVVLIQNGIFWLLDERTASCAGKVYAMRDDILARGYSESDCPFQLIDYSQFVEIVEKDPQFIG